MAEVKLKNYFYLGSVGFYQSLFKNKKLKVDGQEISILFQDFKYAPQPTESST